MVRKYYFKNHIKNVKGSSISKNKEAAVGVTQYRPKTLTAGDTSKIWIPECSEDKN